jgi:hypothetical protein
MNSFRQCRVIIIAPIVMDATGTPILASAFNILHSDEDGKTENGAPRLS